MAKLSEHTKQAFYERMVKERSDLIKVVDAMTAQSAKEALRRIVRAERHNVFGCVVVLSSSIRRAIEPKTKKEN